MSLLKKVSASAIAAVTALSLTSCGKDTTWGAEINGSALRAGIFICFQSDALSAASQKMTENDTDVLAITIDGKPAKDWINDEAVKNMREYAAVESKFDELGLTFDDSDKKVVSNNVEQWWEYVGTYYEKIGVSKQSYTDIMTNSQKRLKLFNYYYGEGGELAVSDEEIKNYLLEKNARIKFIKMPLKDGEGNLLKSEGKAELKKMAEDYIERAKNGESFEAIEDEYNEYYDSLVAAAADGQGAENAQNTETPAETETASGEETEQISYGTLVSKDSSIPSDKVVETVFGGELNVGDYTLVEENEVYYIVYKMDLFADEAYFDGQRDSALNSMKGDEFDETVSGWTDGQNVVINDAALDRYKVEKLTEE